MVFRFNSVDRISLFASYFLAFALIQNPRLHGDSSPSFLWHPRPWFWDSGLLWNVDIMVLLMEFLSLFELES